MKEDDYQMLEYVVDGVTIERFYDSLQSTHSKLVIIVNAAFKAFLDHLFFVCCICFWILQSLNFSVLAAAYFWKYN